MISILFRTIQMAIGTAGLSAFYIPPLFIVSALAFAANLYFLPPWHITLIIIISVMFFATPYTTVLLQAMLRPYESLPSFWRGILWQAQHTDFIIFVTLAFLLLGFGMLSLFDAALFFSDVITKLEGKLVEQTSAAYSFKSSSLLLLLFGSRAAAVGAVLFGLWIWFYFFRLFIRMPAHADGYNVSSEEAMDLTRHAKWQIFFSSLILNGALAAIGVWLAPWSVSPLWLKSLLVGGGVWIMLHTNIAYSVILYQTITPGYTMRKLRY